jgi:hypothetical protein
MTSTSKLFHWMFFGGFAWGSEGRKPLVSPVFFMEAVHQALIMIGY